MELFALTPLTLCYRCQDEHEHAEFKKHIGGGCVCFDHQEGTLNVLVWRLHFISYWEFKTARYKFKFSQDLITITMFDLIIDIKFCLKICFKSWSWKALLPKTLVPLKQQKRKSIIIKTLHVIFSESACNRLIIKCMITSCRICILI